MFYKEEEIDADRDAGDGAGERIDREAYHKDFETLELSVNASPSEVTDAYRHLKEAYSPDLVSLSSPVQHQIEKKRRQDMIGQIEAAYRSLERLFEKEAASRSPDTGPPTDEAPFPPDDALRAAVETGPEVPGGRSEASEVPEGEQEAPEKEPEAPEAPEGQAEAQEGEQPEAPEEDPEAGGRPMPDLADFSGQTLREIREQLKVPLEEIYEETKIRIQNLERLETEQFAELPPEVYVKGFVKSYARCLSLDPDTTVRIYMEKYRDWQRRKGGKRNRQQHHAPFRFSRKKAGKGEGIL